MKYDLESINKRKTYMKFIKKVLEIIAIILIYNIILTNISIENEDESNLFGYKSYIIKTNSMEPTISVNDVVVTKEVTEDKIEEDDTITFKYKGKTITHRITQIEEIDGVRKYTTKGDNNNMEDTFKISYADIEGKLVLIIPYLGVLIELLENKIIFLIILLIILISILFIIQKQEKKEIRREKKKIEKSKHEKN